MIIHELCLRLAKYEPSFGQIKQINSHNNRSRTEILYDALRTSMQKPKRKKSKISFSSTAHESTLPKERLSSLRPRLLKPTPIISTSPTSSSSSRKRPFSSLKNSAHFNQDASFISYPPRRYVFAGAEVFFSSDDDDDTSDDDLPRKHTE